MNPAAQLPPGNTSTPPAARWPGLRRMGLWLLPLLLGGCLESKDELTIEPDGSGQVRFEVRTALPADILENLGPFGNNVAPYPPLSEAQAQRLFPSEMFALTVQETPGDTRSMLVQAKFKNIAALLASPYAKVHALSLVITNDRLQLSALSGFEAAARVAEIQDADGEMASQFPMLPELKKKAAEMRHEFRVLLPRPALEGNGVRAGRATTWREERAKATNSNQFAERLSARLEASCAADGFPAIASQPLHLSATPFRALQAGPVGSATPDATPAADRVIAAARFVPHSLRVTRALDFSGERGVRESQAILTGALILPGELAPARWGDIEITEVIDAAGRNLRIIQNDGSSMPFRSLNHTATFSDDTSSPSAAPAGAKVAQKVYSMLFRSPEWQVKEIARLTASVALQYSGNRRHRITLTNVIPAKLIRDASKSMEDALENDLPNRPISEGALKAVDLKLTLQMAMAQPGYTVIILGVEGRKESIVEAQVYDDAGRPWPTSFSAEDGARESCQFIVTGRPQPPLSLAFDVNTSGAGVKIPITLTNLPLAGSPNARSRP